MQIHIALIPLITSTFVFYELGNLRVKPFELSPSS
jgi:hypothetical protein